MTPDFPLWFHAPDPDLLKPGILPHGEMECGMTRMGVQCNNLTSEGMLYPFEEGGYVILAVCEMCFTEWNANADRQKRRDL